MKDQVFPFENVAKYNKHLKGITRDLRKNMKPILRKQQFKLCIVKSKPVSCSFAPELQRLSEKKHCFHIINGSTNQKKHSLMSKRHLLDGGNCSAATQFFSLWLETSYYNQPGEKFRGCVLKHKRGLLTLSSPRHLQNSEQKKKGNLLTRCGWRNAL